MSEMLGHSQEVAAYIAERKQWVMDAVEVVTGDPGLDPLEVFPAPPQVRDGAPDPGWDAQTEQGVREVMSRFGIGSEIDIPSGANEEIIDPGLAWKIESEEAVSYGRQTFAGSGRQLRPDELAHIERRYGAEAVGLETEYDFARFRATQTPGFQSLEEELPLPVGYEVGPGFVTVKAPTGQLVQIGVNHNGPVRLLRVDGYQVDNGKGGMKTKNPDGMVLMRLVSDLLTEQGDNDSSVGLVTSNTYGGSRAIDAVRAGLTNGRLFTVGMYGRQTLADIKGSAPEPSPTNQLPGELHVTVGRLTKLEAELAAAQS